MTNILSKMGKSRLLKEIVRKKLYLHQDQGYFRTKIWQITFLVNCEFYECLHVCNVLFQHELYQHLISTFFTIANFTFYTAGQSADGSPFTWAHRDHHLFKPGNFCNLEVLFDLCQAEVGKMTTSYLRPVPLPSTQQIADLAFVLKKR